MRSARLVVPAVLVLVVALGLALRHAAHADRIFEQSNGVFPYTAVVHVAHRQQACESGIALDRPVHRLQFVGVPEDGPAPQLAIRVTQEQTGRVLTRATAPAGPPTTWTYSVPVPAIDASRPIDICITNRTGPTVAFLGIADDSEGGPPEAVSPPQSRLLLDGRPMKGDMTMDFPYEHPTSLLSQVPRAIDRAAQYRLPGFGAWGTWLLLVLAVTAAPAVLLLAAAAALRDDAAER